MTTETPASTVTVWVAVSDTTSRASSAYYAGEDCFRCGNGNIIPCRNPQVHAYRDVARWLSDGTTTAARAEAVEVHPAARSPKAVALAHVQKPTPVGLAHVVDGEVRCGVCGNGPVVEVDQAVRSNELHVDPEDGAITASCGDGDWERLHLLCTAHACGAHLSFADGLEIAAWNS